MIINANSQLGLRFSEPNTKSKLLHYKHEKAQNKIAELDVIIAGIKNATSNIPSDELNKYLVPSDKMQQEVVDILTKEVFNAGTIYSSIYLDDKSKYFFICDSVYKCAELIRIGENFTGRTIKDIKLGKYTYLLGKNQMVRFIVEIGGIWGFYYDDKNNIEFDFGIEMKNGRYFFDENHINEFSMIMRLLTFIELGDIEVLELAGGRNNGGKKDTDKITNTTKNTVYVVDSSWNKLIIRTDGFAVRGHFRLQPFGYNMADRKLIWIDAFEKNGYVRKPKAQILND